jgi:hypothetical protein
MFTKITDKIMDNIHYVFGVLGIVLLALICYGLGSQSKTNKFCDQIGGVYVQTWNGYKCIHVTEITL